MEMRLPSTRPERPAATLHGEGRSNSPGVDIFPTRDEAFTAERQIRRLSRAKKEALIAGDWERLKQLSRNRQVEPERGASILRQAQDERGWDSGARNNSDAQQ